MLGKNIYSLTYEEAKNIALEELDIKGHQCILTDFGNAFGYSILVFKNGKHIHFANDYELHHHYLVQEKGRDALKAYYIETMNHKLYTDEELLAGIKTYDEYDKKQYFLRNYWIMRYENVSIFCIGDEESKTVEGSKASFPFYNPVSFCYVADKGIVEDSLRFHRHLEKEYEALKGNDETFREMVRRELANHEACITCDYTDALDALGIKYDELTEAQKKIVKEELHKETGRYCMLSA